MGGYCPVCIIEARKWEMGRKEFPSTYDGTTYYFPSVAIRKKFEGSPAAYVPAFNGDCIVCYAKAGKRVPGVVQHSALYKKRLYLFPSASEKRAFLDAAEQFMNTDLAAEGKCVVCLARAGKHVQGAAKFTEIHNGFRYLFPSAAEQAEFRRQPAKYAATAMKAKVDSAAMRQSISDQSTILTKTINGHRHRKIRLCGMRIRCHTTFRPGRTGSGPINRRRTNHRD